jgi:8-oxo-dGTP pyrophosphatase MutT (NUDIX family)
MKKWETLKSEMALDEKWYKVRKDTVKLPNGKIMNDYFLGLRGRYVQMVPIFENGDVLLVKQYKHGAGDFTIEMPAGMVNEGEDPLVCAKRELMEETGYEGSTWKSMGVIHENPTKSVNESFWYVVTGLKESGEQHFDESEEIEVLKIHYKKLIEMIKSGEIITGPTIGALLLALLELDHLKIV